MAASAEPPPAGLIDAIRRRHRRHVRRVIAACAAAVAVAGTAGGLVVIQGTPGAADTDPGAFAPAVSPSKEPASTPTAAPGTVLRDCQSNNNGTLGSGWKAHSVHAGPVWFLYARSAGAGASQRLTAGKVTTSAMTIAISNGRTAVVTVALPARERFGFLDGFNSTGNYTLRDGSPSLTLAGCPPAPAAPDIPASYAPGLTMFWQGMVTDLRGCIPLIVRTPPARTAIRVTISPNNGSCSS